MNVTISISAIMLDREGIKEMILFYNNLRNEIKESTPDVVFNIEVRGN